MSSTQRGVDKASRLPAYAQLADILRTDISRGVYPAGEKLPAEATLAKSFGVSTMTARQAVRVLEEEGLVRRVQGSGTFIRKIGVLETSFGLEALGAVFGDRENVSVQIINASVKRSIGPEREVLGLADEDTVIAVERVILHRDHPFTLHVSYTGFDPSEPTVESMLDTSVLTSLMFQESYSNFKRGELSLLPVVLDDRESRLLKKEPGRCGFKLEHTFYDFDDKPAAYGWFLVPHENMPLVSRVGVWND
jgi:GntR family transcriptional regulator